jgi:hypothetical protein
MSVQPTGTLVPTPAVPAGVDQLSDIATVISSNDPHLAHGGVYETACGPGQVTTVRYPCAPINFNRYGYIAWVPGNPATVHTGLQCVGPMDLASMQASALRNIDLRVNRTIQDNLIGAFIPISDFDTRPASDAGGLADADQVARCEYMGQAVIHLNPVLAEQWMGKEIIRVGRHLETVMGAMISLNCWLPVDQIAVTGALTVYKGANRVMDPLHDVDQDGAPTNLWYVPIQTPVTVFNDCNLAVLITGVTGGGGPDVPTQPILTSISPTQMEFIDKPRMLNAFGTDFTKTSIIYVNFEPISTEFMSESNLIGILVATDVLQEPGTVQVTVGGAEGSFPLQFVEPVEMSGPASTMVSPAAGRAPGSPMYFRLYEYIGFLGEPPEHPDGTSDLTDADIVSIDWGDGTALQLPPYTRVPRAPLYGGFIEHTYANAGAFDITANLAANWQPATTAFNDYPITITYFLQKNPGSGGVLINAPFGVRPVDGASTPLPPDQHFTSINWGDGTAVQSPPYTVDGGGYATHAYAAAGSFTPSVVFASGQTTNTTIDVTVAATQEDLDAYNAAWEASQEDEGRDAKE